MLAEGEVEAKKGVSIKEVKVAEVSKVTSQPFFACPFVVLLCFFFSIMQPFGVPHCNFSKLMNDEFFQLFLLYFTASWLDPATNYFILSFIANCF